MEYPLQGQVALVTGGARRVGAAIVRELHAAGASVLIHCNHSRAAGEALAADLNQHRGGTAEIIGADLLRTDELPTLVSAALEVFGGLDIVVNNASTFYPTPLGAITSAQWDDLMGSNLKAPLFLAQAAAPALRESRGLLVNIADIHGLRPLGGHTVYSTAKAGLIMLTKSLARELAPDVRVNAIAPGPVLWPEGGLENERQQRIVEQTLLKRAGTPEDIARTVRFFAVDAPYVTGQILAVDGGRSVSS